MYPFSEEVRLAYESMPVPLAYYQRDGEKIIPILVSDGLCRMMHTERPALIDKLSSSMLELVHPDDVGRIARAVNDFSHRINGFNVVYRSYYMGEYRYVHAVGRYQDSPDGSDLAVFVYTDISDNQSERNALVANYELSQKDRFYTDHVTGLPNINFMREFAGEKVTIIRQMGNKPVLIYFDVNGLRSYNSQYGFEQGDDLLRLIASVLKAEFPKGLIIRGVEDHFLVLTCFEGAEALSGQINAVNDKVKSNSTGNTTGLQAGVYVYAPNANTFDAIENATHAQKQIGDDLNITHLYFRREDDDTYWRHRYIIEAFDLALNNHWIKVFYQPIVRSDTKETVKLEALARWIDPSRGTISPGEFIPALSKYHLLHRLDLYMLEQVCRETNIRKEIGFPMIPVSVNLSAQDFDHVDMVEKLIEITDRHGVSHDQIIIEITEQDIARGTSHFLEQLQMIRKNGFKLWLDDFGSGYSSLNVFSQFDVDLVKLDLNLLRHLDDHNGANRTVLKAMVDMARELGIHTLAEGVERTDQDDFIASIGCELEQGYYFYRPESLDDHIYKFRKRVGNNLSPEQIRKVLAWIKPDQ